MSIRLDGRVAIVTGAGRGLGRSHALALAARGAAVVVNDLGTSPGGAARLDSPADGVVAEIEAAGGTAVADDHSVAEPDGAATIVDAALERFGRVDILVNNAGITDETPLADSDPAAVGLVLDTHLLGTINMVRSAWSPLADSGGGRIVNTSSGAVFGSVAGTAYQAAKAGVIAVTRSAALAGEGVGVKVNAILPTAYTRLLASIPDDSFRQFMEDRFPPERASELVVVLASDACPISGESLLVGGGRLARLALAVTEGYISDNPSPEDYLAHLDQVLDESRMFVPKDRAGEFTSYLGRLGFAGADDLDSGALSSGPRAQGRG